MVYQMKKTGWWLLGLLIVGVLLGCDISTPTGGTTTTQVYAPGEWIQVEEYTIIVHEVVQETLTDDDGTTERVIYLNVEYDNQGNEPFNYSLNQWSIFDTVD